MSNTNMKVATRAFTANAAGYHGERVAEGERIAGDHPIVAAHPEHFRTRPLEEELEIRSARLAELDQRARITDREPLSESSKRDREKKRFWERATRLVDTETTTQRRERQASTDAMDIVEAYDAGSIRAEHETLLEGWNGTLRAGRVAG